MIIALEIVPRFTISDCITAQKLHRSCEALDKILPGKRLSFGRLPKTLDFDDIRGTLQLIFDEYNFQALSELVRGSTAGFRSVLHAIRRFTISFSRLTPLPSALPERLSISAPAVAS